MLDGLTIQSMTETRSDRHMRLGHLRYTFSALILFLSVPAHATAQASDKLRPSVAVAPLIGVTFGSEFNQRYIGVQIERTYRSRRITLDGKALHERGRVCVIEGCIQNNGVRVGVGIDQFINHIPQKPAPYVGAHIGLQSQHGEHATVGMRAGIDFLNDAAVAVRAEVGLVRITGANHTDIYLGLAAVISL